jgi:hypothetical protein
MEGGRRNGSRFRVDDLVFFSPATVAAGVQLPGGGYTVVAVLPPDHTGRAQYRLRPTGTGPQRVATELELQPDDAKR